MKRGRVKVLVERGTIKLENAVFGRCPALIFGLSETRQHVSDALLLRVATLRHSLPPLYISSRVSTFTLVSRCPLPLVYWHCLLCCDVCVCLDVFSRIPTFSVASRRFQSHPNVFSCVPMFSVMSRCFPPFILVFSSFRVSKSCLPR